MLLKELFKKENINCPEWLSYKMIDDYWEEFEYSYDNDVHNWSHKDEVRNVEIQFDGETYTFGAYLDNDFHVLEIITESEMIQV